MHIGPSGGRSICPIHGFKNSPNLRQYLTSFLLRFLFFFLAYSLIGLQAWYYYAEHKSTRRLLWDLAICPSNSRPSETLSSAPFSLIVSPHSPRSLQAAPSTAANTALCAKVFGRWQMHQSLPYHDCYQYQPDWRARSQAKDTAERFGLSESEAKWRER